MPDKVYALHQFEPQNEDELTFKPNDIIEVLERDDEFGDGWWLGMNLSTGAVGLFPKSYTTPADANSIEGDNDGALTPLNEVSEPSTTPPPTAKPLIPLSDPTHDRRPSVSSSLVNAPKASQGEVQRAIASLADDDGYSFRSRTTSVVSMSVDDHEPVGGVWDSEARAKLAEQAKLAVAEQEKENEEDIQLVREKHIPMLAPPIHIPMSDSEEDSEPSDDEDEEHPWGHETKESSLLEHEREPTPVVPAVEGEVLPVQDVFASARLSDSPASYLDQKPVVVDSTPPPPEPTVAAPIPAINTITATPTPVHTTPAHLLLSPSPPSSEPNSPPAISPPATSPPANPDPTTWSLPDVLAWLRSKHFSEDVLEKFIEQDITGDVLLSLDDLKVLKEEIGILAFGKRVRVLNAIADLKASLEKAKVEAAGQGEKKDKEPLTPAASQFSGSGGGSVDGRSLTPVGSYDSSPVDKRDSAGAGQKESVRRRLFGRSGGGESLSLKGDTGSKRSSTKEPLSATSSTHFMQDDDGHPIILQGPPSLASPKHKKGTGSVDSGGVGLGLGVVHSRKNSFDGSSKKGKSTGSGPRPSLSSPSPTAHRTSLFGTFGSSSKSKPKRKEVPKDSGAVSDSEASSPSGGGFHLGVFHTRGSSTRPSTPSLRSSSKKDAMDGEAADVGGEFGAKEKEKEKPNMLRKRTSSYASPLSSAVTTNAQKPATSPSTSPTTSAKPKAPTAKSPTTLPKAIDQIGEPDYKGWMRKKAEKYGGWKLRFFVLKDKGLYILRSENERKVKAFIDIVGFKVTYDENLNPGKYGFKIEHDNGKKHFFCSDDKGIIRGWMKAIMKATIGRDYTRPVISSVNMRTIPLLVAQAMNPPPRPPSPGERDRAQKSWRRENPNQLSSRDARVLMGLTGREGDGEGAVLAVEESPTLEVIYKAATSASPPSTPKQDSTPARPARKGSMKSVVSNAASTITIDNELIDWANSHLPSELHVALPPPSSPSTSIVPGADPIPLPITGLHLLRIGEHIKGTPSSPPVPDSAFPTSLTDDKLDGLFKLFDFLLDNDVKMGSVSINDVRVGRTEKVGQVLGALKDWEKRRRLLVEGLGSGSGGQHGYNSAAMAMGGFVGLG